MSYGTTSKADIIAALGALTLTNDSSPAMDLASIGEALLPDDLVKGSSLFVAGNLDTQEGLIASFHDNGGEADSDNEAIDFHFVRVRVKGPTYPEAYSLANKIRLALQSISSFNFNAKKLVGLWCDTYPTHIGKNQRDEPVLIVDFKVCFEPEQTGNRS